MPAAWLLLLRLAVAAQRRQQQSAEAAASEAVAEEAVLNKGDSGSATDNAQTLPLTSEEAGVTTMHPGNVLPCTLAAREHNYHAPWLPENVTTMYTGCQGE